MWRLVDDLNVSKWGCSLSQWNSALDEHTVLKIPLRHLFYTLWVIALSTYNSSMVGSSYNIFFLSRGTLYSQEMTSYNSNIFLSTRFSKYHCIHLFCIRRVITLSTYTSSIVGSSYNIFFFQEIHCTHKKRHPTIQTSFGYMLT
jgi:hypothetical protein